MTKAVKENMNETIKERIEQIQEGRVPEGYKETKIGIIPEKWQIKKLGELGEIHRGKGIPKSRLRDQGVPCVLYGELYTKYDNVIKDLDSRTDNKTAENSLEIKYGDVLFTGSGETPEEIGKAAMYVVENETAYAGGDLVVLRPKKEIRNEVYGYLLNADYVKKQKYKKAQGHSVVHIYGGSIKKLLVPFIPPKEQQQIANILSTWDRAIELKEALIKEKEEQKKGLVKRLFTNENYNWRTVKLSEVVYEPNKKRVETPWNIELLSVRLHDKGVVKSGNYPNKTLRGRPYYHRYKGELLIGRQNFHNGGIGFVVEEHDSLICSNAITSLLPKEGVDMYYIYCYLSNPNYYRRIESLIGGTGQKEISKRELMNLVIKLPSKSEQNEISAILSAADQEISLLKQEVELLKEQKKGLMQLLLTGIVRVGEVEEIG